MLSARSTGPWLLSLKFNDFLKVILFSEKETTDVTASPPDGLFHLKYRRLCLRPRATISWILGNTFKFSLSFACRKISIIISLVLLDYVEHFQLFSFGNKEEVLQDSLSLK
jgi:hypothetical protein